MKKKLGLIVILSIYFFSAPLRAAHAPIQRIDIMNTLWNFAVITQTAVLISFNNGQDIPCFTAKLDFQRAITVWAGVDQACVYPITEITITPLDVSLGTIYKTPPVLVVDGRLYSTQISLNQALAPTFDPSNGALIQQGTVLTTLVSNIIP